MKLKTENSKIRIGIDTRPLYNQSASRGIGVYTSHLIKYLNEIEQLETIEIKTGKISSHIDIIHYPWFDLYFRTLPIRKSNPTIVTIHDVTQLVLSDFYPPGIKGAINFQLQKFALHNVSGIITDSDVSSHDVVKYLSVPKSKVHTVHLAPQDGLVSEPSELPLSFYKTIKTKYNLPDKYVLYVGDLNRNKNVISLIRACKQLQITLVIAGKQAVDTKYDHQHIENLDLATLQTEFDNDPLIKKLGYVSTKELSVLFKLASVYCQPSYYEGFGVPILEAMICNCPVVASKTGSLPEIGGKAVIYTEPTISKLAKALKFVLQLSPVQRKRLIQEGQKQAKKFSWQKTAQKTFKIYQQIFVNNSL